MCQPGPFASAADALAAVTAGLSHLAGLDMTTLTTAEQAECLRGLGRADAQAVAARSAVLGAFDRSRGFEADAAGGARSWLRWQTQITQAAAAGELGWMRRLATHPVVAAALAAGRISPSWARHICDWTDQLPECRQPDGDGILLSAAAGGAELADLAGLAEEMHRQCAQPDGDGDDDGFRSRSLRLTSYFRGEGQLTGNLTPECTAAVRAVLDALGAKAGREDTRTQAERDHDALAEAMRRLVAAGCLPDRGGQPTVIQLHMSLDQLLGLPGADQVTAEWAGWGATAAPWRGLRREDRPRGHRARGPGRPRAARARAAPPQPGAPQPGALAPAAASARTREMTSTAARELAVSRALRLLSGPAGLAAWLRTSLTAGPAATISLPMDVGLPTEIIPPHLRRAVALRDKHCSFPGCQQPPQPARCTTSSSAATAGSRAWTTACCCARSTICAPSTDGAGRSG